MMGAGQCVNKMTLTLNGDEITIYCEATAESDASETVRVRKK